MLLPAPNFWKHIAHGVSEDIHELVEKRFLETEGATITDGAAQDAAQYVVAVVVAGLDAVGNGKTERPNMVCLLYTSPSPRD